MGYWPEELIYIINHHRAVTSGLHRWTHIVDTPVSRESFHNEVPRGQKCTALIVVLYLCTFFACFCLIDVRQYVKRHHVIMRLYSYISGDRVVLESIFDTGQPAISSVLPWRCGERKYILRTNVTLLDIWKAHAWYFTGISFLWKIPLSSGEGSVRATPSLYFLKCNKIIFGSSISV